MTATVTRELQSLITLFQSPSPGKLCSVPELVEAQIDVRGSYSLGVRSQARLDQGPHIFKGVSEQSVLLGSER